MKSGILQLYGNQKVLAMLLIYVLKRSLALERCRGDCKNIFRWESVRLFFFASSKVEAILVG